MDGGSTFALPPSIQKGGWVGKKRLLRNPVFGYASIEMLDQMYYNKALLTIFPGMKPGKA